MFPPTIGVAVAVSDWPAKPEVVEPEVVSLSLSSLAIWKMSRLWPIGMC